MGTIISVSLLFHSLIVSISLISAEECYDTGNFRANSTYANNRDLLLSSLASNVTANGGFYNTTIGQYNDTVYALVLCISDPSAEDCASCVNSAIQELIVACPSQKEAISWGGDPVPCIVRYANRPILGTMELSPTDSGYNTGHLKSNLTDFDHIWTSLMTETVARASMNSSRLKMAAGVVNLTSSEKIYVLMQCTPDISQSDCSYCLRNTVTEFRKCCFGRQGGYVQKPNCFLRWDLYPFYQVFSESPGPPPDFITNSPSPTNTTSTINEGKGGVSTVLIIAVVIPVAVSLVLCYLGFGFLSRRAKTNKYYAQENDVANEITNVESLQFDLSSIEDATNHFSSDNKLGEGGFGAVYKGTLPNEQAIAVKRLSKGSGQGAAEFTNEVILVAKLQHRNLVRLLGFCLEGEEKILVYEYVPNKSLDYFLFDPEKQGLLDWSKRYRIIGGIARGILYLHEDSRLRVIHRDLKASNILLDGDMNAKVSDFGMARIFGVDQTQGSTNRIVGTYGYMSPEYAMHGQFSVKSDVYSFGVLILEIISGKKSSSFYQTGGAADLASYVWRHWRDETPLEVMDPTLTDTYSRSEIIRCIHIGLLCVQEDPASRPAMAAVVLMLNSYSITLALPQEPAFFLHSRTDQGSIPSNEFFADQSKSNSVPYSVDDGSITEVYPR